MGQRIIQKIYVCALCGKTPGDSEKLYHMNNNEIWCEECCNKEEEKNE